jgi:hypothetical protein
MPAGRDDLDSDTEERMGLLDLALKLSRQCRSLALFGFASPAEIPPRICDNDLIIRHDHILAGAPRTARPPSREVTPPPEFEVPSPDISVK